MRECSRVLACFTAFVSVFAVDHDSPCDFRHDQAACICDDGADMRLSYVPPHTKSLTIANCRQVYFDGAPFKDLTLDHLEIANSSSVRIPRETFLGVKKIFQVEFVNLMDLQIKTLCFLKADEVELRNVNIKTLQTFAIPGEAPIRVLRILNSAIGSIADGGLHFKNGTSLEIVGCKIGLIESNGVTVEHAVDLTLRKSEFSVGEDGLNLINVSKVWIHHNEIHATSIASFLPSSVGEIRVSNNDFRHVGAQTFYHMTNVDKVIMENNRFIQVDEEGLRFHSEAGKMMFVAQNNRFVCDCSLAWLWREGKNNQSQEETSEFEKFANSSVCDRPEAVAGLHLVDVFPFVKKNECLRIEPVIEIERKRGTRKSPAEFGSFRFSSSAAKAAVDLLTLALLSTAAYTIRF